MQRQRTTPAQIRQQTERAAQQWINAGFAARTRYECPVALAHEMAGTVADWFETKETKIAIKRKLEVLRKMQETTVDWIPPPPTRQRR